MIKDDDKIKKIKIIKVRPLRTIRQIPKDEELLRELQEEKEFEKLSKKEYRKIVKQRITELKKIYKRVDEKGWEDLEKTLMKLKG